jgi:uncharacterized protein
MTEPFKTSRISINVSDKLGSVSAEIYEPETVSAVITLGHGAGSNMDQPFLKQLSSALAKQEVAVMRFNFLYTENRKKMPDRFPTASAVVIAAVNEARRRFPTQPLFCAGKSFGGRMSSMTLAEHPNLPVKGIVFFGFPLHPAGSPSVERAVHLEQLTVPLLFLQGTRDDLATPELLRGVITKLQHPTLVEFEGADHSFKGGKKASVEALAHSAAAWIKNHI